MKNVLINISLLLGLITFFSCEKDETKAILNPTPDAPAILSPADGTTKVLTVADSAVVMDFIWSAADFGFASEVVYSLQLDKAGNNFAEPIGISSITSSDSASMIIYDFNGKLLALGLDFNVESEVELRLRAIVNGINSSGFSDTVYSDVITMNVTPFEVIIVYPKLFMPGSYQGWNFGETVDFLYDVKSNDRYEGYTWFADATTTFKLTRVADWIQNQTIGDAVSGGTSGTLVVGDWGNDITVAGGPGYFKINADLGAATYSWMKTDWGLIGSATPNGWDSDQNMTYDLVTDTWSITLDLVIGKIKFRANDDWALNYGDDEADGKLEPGGTDIDVPEAGNYTVTLDLSRPIYTFELVKN